MPRRRTKVSRPVSPILNPKIGCHGNVPWAIEKGGEVGNLRSNSYHMVKSFEKYGENRYSGFEDNLSERFILKIETSSWYMYTCSILKLQSDWKTILQAM